MWPLGAVAGPVGEIPARPAAFVGREWARGGPGGAPGRCGRLAGAEMLSATAVGGTPGRRPRWPAVRRVAAQGGVMVGCSSFYGS
jgi:hypothetical protein